MKTANFYLFDLNEYESIRVTLPSKNAVTVTDDIFRNVPIVKHERSDGSRVEIYHNGRLYVEDAEGNLILDLAPDKTVTVNNTCDDCIDSKITVSPHGAVTKEISYQSSFSDFREVATTIVSPYGGVTTDGRTFEGQYGVDPNKKPPSSDI
ncbi:MAG: hypothetical protein FWE93_05215 [Alphaproteobacteria bacterium]|nr:hypothetical protein [Alphaproteobacteria bacterium]